MSNKVSVAELPKCDFCRKDAHYDGCTILGRWAFMCEQHFKQYSIGLGTGKGQKLVVKKDK